MKYITVTLCLFVLLGCKKGVMNISDLKYKDDGKKYAPFSSEPFSGRAISIYDNGVIQIQEGYLNGLLNGDCFIYYPNGQINEYNFYFMGKKNNRHRSYYENGQIKTEGTYHNDYRSGIWRYYSVNGEYEGFKNFDE